MMFPPMHYPHHNISTSDQMCYIIEYIQTERLMNFTTKAYIMQPFDSVDLSDTLESLLSAPNSTDKSFDYIRLEITFASSNPNSTFSAATRHRTIRLICTSESLPCYSSHLF